MHYADQALTAIRNRFPDVDRNTVVIDRLRFGQLDMAITDGFRYADAATAAAVRHHINELPEDDWQLLNAYFNLGSPFALPFDPVNPDQPVTRLFSPFPVQAPPFTPADMQTATAPWHGDLMPISQRAEQRFSRFVVWHETGHIIAEQRGHDSVFAPPASLNDEPPPMALSHLMRRNADENYADGFGLRCLGADNPHAALDIAQLLSDWRSVNMVDFHLASHNSPIHSQDDSTLYCTMPGINAAIKDIAGYVQPGGKLADPGGTAIANAARDAVIRTRFQPADLAEADLMLDQLKAPTGDAFGHPIRTMGMLGRQAVGPAAYYLCRNYLGAMSRRLPPDHHLQPVVDEARKLTAMNERAGQWDRQCPPVEAAIAAARLQITRRNGMAAAPANSSTPGHRR